MAFIDSKTPTPPPEPDTRNRRDKVRREVSYHREIRRPRELMEEIDERLAEAFDLYTARERAALVAQLLTAKATCILADIEEDRDPAEVAVENPDLTADRDELATKDARTDRAYEELRRRLDELEQSR